LALPGSRVSVRRDRRSIRDTSIGDISDAASTRRARLCAVMLKRAEAVDTEVLDTEDGTTLGLLQWQLHTIVDACEHDEQHRQQLFPFASSVYRDFSSIMRRSIRSRIATISLFASKPCRRFSRPG
jgi:uncharacterized protein (DUF885 family)